MALKPRKGTFMASWGSSKLQTPSSREAPNRKLQRCRALPLRFGAWCFFGIWSLELGASWSLSMPVSVRQRDENVLQRRCNGADVGLVNADAAEALANELLGHRILYMQVHRLAEDRCGPHARQAA